MEPIDNENRTQVDEGLENPNLPQPPNINRQIDEGLTTLWSLVHELRGTQEPTKFFLAT